MSDEQIIPNSSDNAFTPNGQKWTANQKKILIYGILGLSVLLISVFFIIYPFGVEIKLTNDKNIVVEYKALYQEAGFSATDHHIDVSDQVVVSGTVDTSKLGTYTLSYKYKAAGKISKKVTRTIKVVDTTPCEIKLIGSSRPIVLLNGEYKEYGFSAIDNFDGDISANVKISSNVDTTKEGIYEVKYQVIDSNNNESSAVRTVVVSNRNPLLESIAQFSLDGFFPNATLTETADGGAAYISETIFIGDSITGNMGYFNFVPIENVWTRSMLTPESVWNFEINVYQGPSYGTILNNISAYKPKRIILAIGVSGSGWMEPEYFVLKYTQFIQEIRRLSPDTQIIIESILPIDKRHDDEVGPGGFSNQKINILNYYIGQMCEEQNIKFLNVAPVMKNELGQAVTGYTFSNDGIHPTNAAYEKIVTFIKTHTIQ